MRLKIVTREGVGLDRDVKQVTLTTITGAMQVLDLHAGSVLRLKPGPIRYDGTEARIGGGLARVMDNEVVILAEGVTF